MQAMLGSSLFARAARVLVLASADAAALIASVALAYVLWARPVHGQPVGLYLALLPALGLFIAGYAQAGLYPGFGLGPVETLRRLTSRTGFVFLLLAALSFAAKLPYLYSRATFSLAVSFALVLVPLTRWLASVLAKHWDGWFEPVVLVAVEPRLVHRLDREIREVGYRLVGVLRTDSEIKQAWGEEVDDLGSLEVASEVAALGVRVALVDGHGGWADTAILDRLRQQFRHLVMVRDFESLPVEGVQVRNLGALLGLEYTNNLLQRRNRLLKRALDIAVSTTGLLLTAPVIATAALAVKLASPGPAFFGQERKGTGGRRITVWKVRTMHRDAEQRLEAHLVASPALREEWERSYKLKHDPRVIPKLGRLLRMFSIDELPQLWCVLRGDMSLVGPRPFPDYHLARFSPAFLTLRERVRPGITGLWQVTVRSEGSIEEQEALDAYYIRNWSLWLDLYILTRTLSAVVAGRGAY